MAVVYLLHFSSPLGNPRNPRALASHYLGWAMDLDERIRQHRSGAGCSITRAAVERGIGFEVVATWPGDYRLEKHLKAMKAAPRLCPQCGKLHPRGPLCLRYSQLSLFEDLNPFDIPAPTTRTDWYEISYHRRANRWQPPAVLLADQDTSNLDIPF